LARSNLIGMKGGHWGGTQARRPGKMVIGDCFKFFLAPSNSTRAE
jgi:hypothetical protein